ncbi:hypothetical protein [Streptomyces palmae]|uniref:Chaplin n=1 Tax=Streptomyces palmae TaxID=1701085 RepID=A0A4Z0GM07_9ACTN|nr:hypothetical protein [Streptomyces palmae]TGA98053.1 hypothetical protein E4099_23180 [Streptomyces palmae]
MRVITGFAGVLLAGAAVLGASGIAGAQEGPELDASAAMSVPIGIGTCGSDVDIIAIPINLQDAQAPGSC